MNRRGRPVNLVVVSNRVARGKPNEPMTGGWAAALHSRSDLIRVSRDDYVSYREVNAFMARALMRFRKTKTAFWVQDYHFLALGAELRDLGVDDPIGFFLHTPWPVVAVMQGVPNH